MERQPLRGYEIDPDTVGREHMAVPVPPVIRRGKSPADTAEVTDQAFGRTHLVDVSRPLGGVKQIDVTQIGYSKDQIKRRLRYDNVRYYFEYRCFCSGGALR